MKLPAGAVARRRKPLRLAGDTHQTSRVSTCTLSAGCSSVFLGVFLLILILSPRFSYPPSLSLTRCCAFLRAKHFFNDSVPGGGSAFGMPRRSVVEAMPSFNGDSGLLPSRRVGAPASIAKKPLSSVLGNVANQSYFWLVANSSMSQSGGVVVLWGSEGGDGLRCILRVAGWRFFRV